MQFDSEEKSPCRGCELESAPKVMRRKQGCSTMFLRDACRSCDKLKAYQLGQLGHRHQIAVNDNLTAAPIGESFEPLSQRDVMLC